MPDSNSAIELGGQSDTTLLFGGPYSNLAATQAMRETAEALDIPPSSVICTGDLVAYCAEPDAVVNEIRHWGISVVMGNCEESLARNSSDCGCGFDSGSSCALLSDTWYRYSDQHISDENRAWMSQLPREVRFELSGQQILVTHGAPSSINRFIFPSTPIAEKNREILNVNADIVIGGHSGIPFGQKVGKDYWLNSGVIGMPANDGTTTGWYMLLRPSREGITVEWRRLNYDWKQAQQAMLAGGLNNGYAQALETGRWPSLDVLPNPERTRQGLRIELPPLQIPSEPTAM